MAMETMANLVPSVEGTGHDTKKVQNIGLYDLPSVFVTC